MANVDVKALLAAGAHFGHKTSRWHPKMAPYIHSSRGGAHIIDLIKTAEELEQALAFIEDTVAQGKQVLFVGTKRQAQGIVKKAAEDTAMPAVYNRWLGGMLTNTKTMKSHIKHLKKLEEQMDAGELAQRYSKLEVQRFQEEIDKLNNSFGGVKDMDQKPGAVFVTDILTDDLAVNEARRLDVPVVAIVDTNTDPTLIDYPIPANDDAIKSLQIITDYVVDAIARGKSKQKQAKTAVKKNAKSASLEADVKTDETPEKEADVAKSETKTARKTEKKTTSKPKATTKKKSSSKKTDDKEEK